LRLEKNKPFFQGEIVLNKKNTVLKALYLRILGVSEEFFPTEEIKRLPEILPVP